jgi:hypothetical protein
VAHAVLEQGPGWTWDLLQTFYSSPGLYTQQLRDLEHYIADHGDQAAPRFLLAYEYLMLGHFDAAKRQLTRVVAQEPRDLLAANILAGLNRGGAPQGPGNPPSGAPMNPPAMPNVAPMTPVGPSTSVSPQPPVTPTPPTPPAPTITPAPVGPVVTPATPSAPLGSLVGSWKATPGPGVEISVNLQNDGKFTWSFSEGAQKQSFNGKYVQQGDSLILTRDQDGQKMDGTVTKQADGFRFRLKNTDPNDPGLDFKK